MNETSKSTALTTQGTTGRLLTAAQFHQLTDVPAAVVWLGNIDNPNTRRAYQGDVEAFVAFCGIEQADELRMVTRAHVIAWRTELEGQELAAATIRRKLSAVSSLFEYLCNENAVESNPVAGVKRPSEDANEGKTPALSDDQAKLLLQAPDGDNLKALRDRAIIAVYLFHALRRSELASLKVGSLQERRGVPHFRVAGKGSKIRFVPVHPAALTALDAYLELAGHGEDKRGPLFRPVRNRRTGSLEKPISGDGIYKMVKRYALEGGCPTSMGSACTRCAQLRRPTPSSTRPTSPTSKSGWATRTSLLRASTTDDVHALRIHPPSRSATEQAPPQAAPGIP
jgi:integrase/recombinase XerD